MKYNTEELSLDKEWLLPVPEVITILRNKIKISDRPSITCMTDAVAIIKKNYDPDTIGLSETFKVIYLNNANRVLGIYTHTSGGIDGTPTDIRLIAIAALNISATKVIFVHNHPSGINRPSEADIKITKKYKEALILLSIEILDHIIITPDLEYYSMAKEGNV